MEITVFYAWQDDRPRKTTRFLIRDALIAACDQLSADKAIPHSFKVDESTKDVPGMCDIPNTILEKINACHIFLADFTFVGESQSRAGKDVKQIPNPNVSLETGYAAHAKGFARLVAVMNKAYGKPDDQMFDTKRRHAITYQLDEKCSAADITRAHKVLAKELAEALAVIAAKSVLPIEGESSAAHFSNARTTFEDHVRRGQFGGLGKHPTIAICLAPGDPCKLDHHRIQESHVRPLGPSTSYDRQNKGQSVVFYRGRYDQQKGGIVRDSAVEITTEGTAMGADIWALGMKPGFPSPYSFDVIPSVDLERIVIRWIYENSQALIQLGIGLPWRVGISLIGIQGYRLNAFNRQMSEVVFDRPDIICDLVRFETLQQLESPKDVALALKPCLDHIWREFDHPGWCPGTDL